MEKELIKTRRTKAFAKFHAILYAAVSDPDIWAPIEFAAIDYASAAATDAIDDLMARIQGDAAMTGALSRARIQPDAAPFAPGDLITDPCRPQSPTVTVTGCHRENGHWRVEWSYRYHPLCSPITGSGPAEGYVLAEHDGRVM